MPDRIFGKFYIRAMDTPWARWPPIDARFAGASTSGTKNAISKWEKGEVTYALINCSD
jgi:hypothetical protein